MPGTTDWNVDPDTFTVPPFLGPGVPGLIVGPDIPAELQTYYNGEPVVSTVVFAIIQQGLGGYFYDALVVREADFIYTSGLVFGGVVHEFERTLSTFVGSQVDRQVGQRDGAVVEYFGTSMDWDDTSQLNVLGAWRIDSINAPRGVRLYDTQDGNPIASSTGAAQVTIIDTANVTFVDQRVYRIWASCRVDSNIAQAFAIRLFKTSTAGQLLLIEGDDSRVGTGNYKMWRAVIEVKNDTGSDITDDLVLTGSGGTVANPINYRGDVANGVLTRILVEDIGNVDDVNFGEAFALT